MAAEYLSPGGDLVIHRRSPQAIRQLDAIRLIVLREEARTGAGPWLRWTARVHPFIISRMSTPQGGIFALGTASHAYLEFDASALDGGRDLVAAISALREPRTTMGGVNLVAGFRPELWREVAPDHAPPGI